MIDPTLLLLQATTPPADTLVQVAPTPFLATAEAISTIVLTLAVLGVLLALILVLGQFRRLTRSVTEVAHRMEKDVGPVLERAKSVAENVDFVTAAVRTDVQKVNESVAHLNDRLNQASERMEERLQDFSALVEVLQGEAESLALDTAAAVRGVRAGTKALAEGNGRSGRKAEGASGQRAIPPAEADQK